MKAKSAVIALLLVQFVLAQIDNFDDDSMNQPLPDTQDINGRINDDFIPEVDVEVDKSDFGGLDRKPGLKVRLTQTLTLLIKRHLF